MIKKNVLITGGTGYLGGRIAHALSNNEEVSSITITTHRQNIHDIKLPFECRIEFLDLSKNHIPKSIFKNIDVIIHLASLNEIESSEDPDKAFIVNSLGTFRLLNKAAMSGVSKIIYFSTAHVYGSPLKGVITERKLPRPTHPYALSHKIGEDHVLSFHYQRKINGLIFRLSNAYGVPIDKNINRWSLVCNDLCRQAVCSKKIVLKSSGMQKRDFIAIDDVTRICEFFMFTEKYFKNGLFNIGGENSLTIANIAEIIAERSHHILGYKPLIEKPYPLPDEKIFDLDYRIDKLKSVGVSLHGNLTAEIDNTLKACRSWFSA